MGVKRNDSEPAADLPRKDSDSQCSVPGVWRPTFHAIAEALARDDFRLSVGVPGVLPINEDTAKQIREYIHDYGEKLTQLPEEAWNSSVCIWMEGWWDVLVDLWTEREGRSDLVLSARVREANPGFSTEVVAVYVP